MLQCNIDIIHGNILWNKCCELQIRRQRSEHCTIPQRKVTTLTLIFPVSWVGILLHFALQIMTEENCNDEDNLICTENINGEDLLVNFADTEYLQRGKYDASGECLQASTEAKMLVIHFRS